MTPPALPDPHRLLLRAPDRLGRVDHPLDPAPAFGHHRTVQLGPERRQLAPEAPDAEPLVAPGWFDCFDAEAIAKDLDAGAARAILAEFNEPYGFDRIIAAYPDGRAFQWRQINACGAAAFDGSELPAGCPPNENSAKE